MEDFLNAVGTLTEIVALHYACMKKTGLSDDVALALTKAFQDTFVSHIISKGKLPQEDEK